jgi:hypothetical protein
VWEERATGGRNVFEGRAAVVYNHGYDAQKFYLGLALDPKYVEGFVEGCLERIGEDEPEDRALFKDLWEDEAISKNPTPIAKSKASGWITRQ